MEGDRKEKTDPMVMRVEEEEEQYVLHSTFTQGQSSPESEEGKMLSCPY